MTPTRKIIMGRFVVGILLPLLLLTAAFLNWSLISLVDLAASLFILYKAPKRGFRFKGLLLLWSIINLSLLFVLSQVTLLIACAIKADICEIADSWWAKSVGFMKLQSWTYPAVNYYLVLKVFVVFIGLIEIHRNKYGFVLSHDSWSARLSLVFEHLGYHVRIAFCFLVPAIQLVVGISKPSWVSLPFFICSCIGLVDWSLSSNFLGLFRWWKQLWIYAGINIILLYVYQLPIGFPNMLHVLAEFVGVYKISANSEGLEVLSGVSIMVFYFMETESPPYLVQLSVDVHLWPEDMIQPERIESGINQLLRIVHEERCKEVNSKACPCASRVQVQSIEKSAEDPNVALAVFEVVYANSWRECEPTERYKSLTPAADVAKEILIAQQSGVSEQVGFPYSILSVIGGGKREIDLYAYIFGADLTVFFLVAIFYQFVIKNQKEIIDVNQLEDQFPKEFVFMLMIIFFLIVLDRIIYLSSFATGKVIFYLFNLVLFTYSVTEYAWQLQSSQESSTGLALRAIYLTKAVSLVLQAIQIRYGTPHKSTLYRQFLTSQVSRVNYLGYKVYRALPFLYELRCVLDWSCTTTSLTMYDWLKLEDIHASLYLVKCDAVLNRSGHGQGEKQRKKTKFCNGICLFFILIFVIWTPILMYSSGNPTNIANPINDVAVQFDILTDGGRLTLFQTTLCERIPWNKLNDISSLDPNGYLDAYNGNDIQLICCQADASTMWLVPDVVQKDYIQSLYSNMEIRFSWELTRDRPKGKELVKYERTIDSVDLPKASDIEEVLNGSTDSFRTNNLYPRYFRITSSGDIRSLEQKADDVSGDLVLNHGNSEWWSFHDVHSSDVRICGDLTGPMAIIINEETPQGFLGETLSKFSILGLYITFVLALGRFIRLQCSDLRMRIPFENLPSCDRLIAFCEDVYAARAEGELGVEEVLYWTVVKIYRSPHMLLEYTKPN